MSKTRIPTELDQFDKYIAAVLAYLKVIISGVLTRGENLGMTSAELSRLADDNKTWRNSDPANLGIYNKHTDPANNKSYTRPTVVKFQSDFADWFSPILSRMELSPNITPQDRFVLHIAEPVENYSHPKEAIADQCNIMGQQLGGGRIKFRCKVTVDTKRPSLAEGSDGVEIAHRIDQPNVDTGTDTGSKSKVKNPIANSGDGTTKNIYTKSTITVDYGDQNSGNVLQLYARYINIKHRNLDGPWTGPYTFIIG